MRRIDRVGKTLTKAIAIALSFSIMFGQTLGSYADELDTINEIVTEAEADVSAAEAVNADFASIVIVDTAEVEAELASYEVSANASEADSNEAISNAKTANTTSVESKAREAKATAEAALGNAETALNDSNAVLESAQNNYNDVSANYAAADSQYNTAVAALVDVSANTVAAELALEEAQALIDAATINRVKLEDMEDQYYGFLVYYFRSAGVAVFNADGTLNIEKSAAKINASKQNTLATKNDTSLFKFGRYLTKEMVEYMICNRADVSANVEENKFTFGAEGGNQTVEGQKAVVFKNGSRQDQTATKETHTDISGNTVSSGDIEYYRWERTNKDGGRGNCVKVTYVDVNGETHTEYYNYVFKTYEEDSDLTTGPIYLALVDRHDGLNNVPSEVSENNNYSNYKALAAAVNAYQILDIYTQRYNEALNNVNELKAQYAALSVSANATKGELDTLKAALEDAKTALAAAEEKKAEVTAKYEEAKKAVEGIDLSRFAVVPVNVVNDDEPAAPAEETPVEEAPVVILLPAAAPVAAPAVAPVAAPAVEEVAEIEQVVAEATIDDEETPLTDGSAITEEVKEEAPVTTAAITADIEDDETALAAHPFADSMKKVWWIWLLILATLITMYIIYKKNNKEEESH